LGIFRPNFTRPLCVHIYVRLQVFIQLSATLTKLCHIKRDHPVYIMCAKCPPSAELGTQIQPELEPHPNLGRTCFGITKHYA